MMRNVLFGAALLLTAAGTARAQSTAGPFERLPTGTEYRLYRKDAAGHYQPRGLVSPADAPYASRAGKVLTVFMDFRTGRDSVLMSSRRLQPVPQPVLLPEKPQTGSLEEALALLLPGDSAVFRLPADTVFAKTFHQPVPPFLQKSGNVLVVLASARELLTMDEMKARQEKLQAEYAKQAQAHSAAQLAQDNAIIQDYLKANHATARKTPGGTYYIFKKLGTGPLPKKGQTVQVRYRGTVLTTGNEFDASSRHGNEPFAFTLGVGQVIPGWDQGIAMLPKGSKAVLLIPSPLAYGPRGAGADIPANAVLRFEVELVDIK